MWPIAVAGAVLALWLASLAARARRPGEENARIHRILFAWPQRTRRRSGRSTGRTRDQTLRDRLILTYAPLVKYVAGRLGSGLPGARRRRRPRLVRPARADRRDRALRSRPRHQVRDLRDRADQGLDHRRAARARLGAALGAVAGARDRARDRRARGEARSCADRRGDRRQARHHRGRARRQPDARSPARRSPRSTSSGRCLAGGDQVSLIDTIEDTQASEPAERARRRPR